MSEHDEQLSIGEKAYRRGHGLKVPKLVAEVLGTSQSVDEILKSDRVVRSERGYQVRPDLCAAVDEALARTRAERDRLREALRVDFAEIDLRKDRARLAAYRDERGRFRARVERLGRKRNRFSPGGVEETILLRDVADATTGEVLADHLWMTGGVWSKGLAAGDVVEFDARAATYEKGYQGRRAESWISTDWRLVRPTRVRAVTSDAANEEG